MRDDSCKIEFEFDSVIRVRVCAEFAAILPPLVDIGVRVTRTTLRATSPWALWIRELGYPRAKIVHRDFIEREHASQSAPFGGHVGNGHARGHRKMRHTVADKFDSVIQHFVLIEQSA